jgi:hypothetical protein
MAGSTIDHLVSLTVLLGAILIFISLFNQIIQTAILYQHHRYLATKCSSLLDNILLNPGYPLYWALNNSVPAGFGLQDPEFTQYRLSPFSLMRLRSATGEPVYYYKTGLYYSNITIGFGNCLLVPYTKAINYSLTTKLLGIDGSHGFQLTITPIITVAISTVQLKSPLILTVDVSGIGSPLTHAEISYCLLTVSAKGGGGEYPSYTIETGTAFTDQKGSVLLNFPDVNGETDSYVLIAYAHLSGLVGMGYYEHATSDKEYIVPLIDDFEERRVLISHSYDTHYFGPPESELKYNATFVVLDEAYHLREMPLGNTTGTVGHVNYGSGQPYGVLQIPTYDPGILVVTYKRSATKHGVVLMPWGISAMGFPVTFGDDTSDKEWVATDLRQVIVDNIAYQAKLALWSEEGYQVIGQ